MNEPEMILRSMVEPMSAFLGLQGLAYFQGIADASRGSLAAANSMLNGGHGMRVRNKMRELLGHPDEGSLPEHFYDNNWELLVKMCMARHAKQNCKVCEGKGVIRPMNVGSFDPLPIEPCPACSHL